MLPFTLISQPETGPALQKLGPRRDLDLLIVYYGELGLREFLGRILGAAGFDEPGTQLHLLEWPVEASLDLTSLIRKLGVKRVILFGYHLPLLGNHFTVANYFPLTVAGITYLSADSLEYILESKERGDNRPAGALWSAVKQQFARSASS